LIILFEYLSLEDQLNQTIESLKVIRNKFGLGYGAFAFPHSDNGVSEEFFVKLFSTGLVDVTFGTSGIIKDSYPKNLQRFNMEKSLQKANNIIKLQYARAIFKVLSNEGKILRK
jgi:hypothetical protein